jgi:hypothetical protein
MADPPPNTRRAAISQAASEHRARPHRSPFRNLTPISAQAAPLVLPRSWIYGRAWTPVHPGRNRPCGAGAQLCPAAPAPQAIPARRPDVLNPRPKPQPQPNGRNARNPTADAPQPNGETPAIQLRTPRSPPPNAPSRRADNSRGRRGRRADHGVARVETLLRPRWQAGSLGLWRRAHDRPPKSAAEQSTRAAP